jgi:hypothetical protein
LGGLGLGKGAFYGSKIEEIDLSRCKALKEINEYTFYDMPELVSLLLPKDGILGVMGKNMFYNSPIEVIDLPSTIYKIESDSKNYFINKCGIKSFTIPKNIITLESSLIYNCDKLESFTFSNYFRPILGKLVENCIKLKDVYLPIYSMNVKLGGTWFVYENNVIKSGPFNTENDAIIEINNYNKINQNNGLLYSIVNKNVDDVIVVNNELFYKDFNETFESCESISNFKLNANDNNMIMISNDNGKSIIRIANGDIINNTITPCDKTLVKVSQSISNYILEDDIKRIEKCALRGCVNMVTITLSNKKYKDKNIRTIADKIKEGSLAMSSLSRKLYLLNEQKYNRINMKNYEREYV